MSSRSVDPAQGAAELLRRLGMAILVIAGHVDLSVGSNIAFSGMIAAIAITKFGVSPPFAILAGVLTGALIGARD